MSRKALVQLASKALALNLVIWAVAGLVYVPAIFVSVLHYRNMGVPAPQVKYFYTYYLIQLSSHLVLSGGLFIASVWVYRCGASIEGFLSPSAE